MLRAGLGGRVFLGWVLGGWVPSGVIAWRAVPRDMAEENAPLV
jgi:hypothetical protein